MDDLRRRAGELLESASQSAKSAVRYAGRFVRRDIGVFQSQVGDSVTFEVRPPFNFNVKQSLIDAGFMDADGNRITNPPVRSVFLKVNNEQATPANFLLPDRKIVGKSAIDFAGLDPQALGLQFDLSIHENINTNGLSDAGVSLAGIAYRDDQEEGVFHLGEGNISYDLITNGTSAAITNLQETRFNPDGTLDADDVAIQFNNISPDAIGDVFGIHANTQVELGNVHTKSFPASYLAGSDRKLYKTEGGFCMITRVDDASSGVPSIFPGLFGTSDLGYPLLVSANFNYRGMLRGFTPIFSYQNTGQNLINGTDALGNQIQLPSSYVPYNGVPLADSESLNIRDFRTEQTPDGNLVVAVAYERHTGAGNSITNAETAGNIMVFDPSGSELSSVRDFQFFESTINPVFQRALRAVGGLGVSADNDGVFASFSKGGASQAQGFFVSTNSTDPENPVTSIGVVPSSQYSSVQVPPRTTVDPEQPFSHVEILSGGGVQVSANYDPNNIIGEEINTITHVMEDGEEYMPAEGSLNVPQRIIVSPGVKGAIILFPSGGSYTYIDQSGNNSTTLLFPEVPQGHDFDLQDVIDADGTPTIEASFPENTYVRFYAESREHVLEVLGNLRRLTTTTPQLTTTQQTTEQTTQQPTDVPTSTTRQVENATSSTPEVTDTTTDTTPEPTQDTTQSTTDSSTTGSTESTPSSTSSTEDSTSTTPASTITTTFSAATNYASSTTISTTSFEMLTSGTTTTFGTATSAPTTTLIATDIGGNNSFPNITDGGNVTDGKNITDGRNITSSAGAIAAGSAVGAFIVVGAIVTTLIIRWRNNQKEPQAPGQAVAPAPAGQTSQTSQADLPHSRRRSSNVVHPMQEGAEEPEEPSKRASTAPVHRSSESVESRESSSAALRRVKVQSSGDKPKTPVDIDSKWEKASLGLDQGSAQVSSAVRKSPVLPTTNSSRPESPFVFEDGMKMSRTNSVLQEDGKPKPEPAQPSATRSETSKSSGRGIGSSESRRTSSQRSSPRANTIE